MVSSRTLSIQLIPLSRDVRISLHAQTSYVNLHLLKIVHLFVYLKDEDWVFYFQSLDLEELFSIATVLDSVSFVCIVL